MAEKHALVFGASGITGWAIVNELLTNHPDAQRFTKVTAVTNRPFPAHISRWPKSSKLDIVSGIDILKGDQNDLDREMKRDIKGISAVTHVYFNCRFTIYITLALA
jgi:nucleoside-diphosphate-sugar epimerase